MQARAHLFGEQARANLKEQAEILADAGVDFLISESTGSNLQRKWVVEACVATGLPLLISTGMASWAEIDTALGVVRDEAGPDPGGSA